MYIYLKMMYIYHHPKILFRINNEFVIYFEKSIVLYKIPYFVKIKESNNLKNLSFLIQVDF